MADADPAGAVREAGPADIEALVESRIALFDELGEGATQAAERAEFRSACGERMAELLRDGRGAAWIATGDSGRVVGAVVLLEFPRLPSPRLLRAREGYVLNVWVDPGARRRGLATALVTAAVAEARRRGHARVRLHSTAAGRDVYARLGFKGRADEMELVL